MGQMVGRETMRQLVAKYLVLGRQEGRKQKGRKPQGSSQELKGAQWSLSNLEE